MKNRIFILTITLISAVLLNLITQNRNTQSQELASVSGSIKRLNENNDSQELRVVIEPIGIEAIVGPNGDFLVQFDADQLPNNEFSISYKYGCSFDNDTPPTCQPLKYSYHGAEKADGFAVFYAIENGETIDDLDLDVEFTTWPKISGVVTDFESGNYVPAKVYLYPAQNTVSSSWQTFDLRCDDSDFDCSLGYEFTVAPNTYSIKVEADGYPEAWFRLSTIDPVGRIEAPLGSEVTDKDIGVRTGGRIGAIHGRVTDKVTNAPISNVYVHTNKGSEQTDINGNFELKNIPFGVYEVHFGFNDNYAHQYYGQDLTVSGSSEPVAVTVDSSEPVVIEQQLEPAGGLQFEFVDLATGKTITEAYSERGIGVDLYTPNGQYYRGFATLRDMSRTYLGGLLPGEYKVFTHQYGIHEFFGQTDRIENSPSIQVVAGETRTVQYPLRFNEGKLELIAKDKESGEKLDFDIPIEIHQIDDACGEDYILYQNIFNDGELNTYVNADYDYEILINSPTEYSFFPQLPLNSGRISFENSPVHINEYFLERGGIIKGSVVDENSQAPISNVDVQIFKVEQTSGEMVFKKVLSRKPRSGEYRSRGLEPGTYAVLFESKYSQSTISQFHGGKLGHLDPQTADPILIEITGNEEVVVNASLKSGYSVEGRLLSGEDGKLLKFRNAYISAYLKTADGYEFIRQIDSNRDGEFEVSGLPAGDYYLKAEMNERNELFSGGRKTTFFGDVQEVDEAELVMVGPDSPNKLLGIKMFEGASIEGKITIEDFHVINWLPRYETKEVFVRVYDSKGLLVKRKPIEISLSNSTNQFSYSINGLWPGKYYLLFESFYLTYSGSCNDQVYVGEWHTGTPNYLLSAPIELLGSEHVKGINGTLSLENQEPVPPSLTTPLTFLYLPFVGR